MGRMGVEHTSIEMPSKNIYYMLSGGCHVYGEVVLHRSSAGVENDYCILER